MDPESKRANDVKYTILGMYESQPRASVPVVTMIPLYSGGAFRNLDDGNRAFFSSLLQSSPIDGPFSVMTTASITQEEGGTRVINIKPVITDVETGRIDEKSDERSVVSTTHPMCERTTYGIKCDLICKIYKFESDYIYRQIVTQIRLIKMQPTKPLYIKHIFLVSDPVEYVALIIDKNHHEPYTRACSRAETNGMLHVPAQGYIYSFIITLFKKFGLLHNGIKQSHLTCNDSIIGGYGPINILNHDGSIQYSTSHVWIDVLYSLLKTTWNMWDMLNPSTHEIARSTNGALDLLKILYMNFLKFIEHYGNESAKLPTGVRIRPMKYISKLSPEFDARLEPTHRRLIVHILYRFIHQDNPAEEQFKKSFTPYIDFGKFLNLIIDKFMMIGDTKTREKVDDRHTFKELTEQLVFE